MDDFRVEVLVFLVLVASVDAWVIIHFHHDEFAIDLFDVYAVEPLADDAARFQRDLAKPGRYSFFPERDCPAPDDGGFASKLGAVKCPPTLNS